MDQINVQFPDGNSKAFDKGITTEEIAQSISPGLRKSGSVNLKREVNDVMWNKDVKRSSRN